MTEVMFFGRMLFAAYALYHHLYPEAGFAVGEPYDRFLDGR